MKGGGGYFIKNNLIFWFIIPSCKWSSEELIKLLGNWNNLKLLDIILFWFRIPSCTGSSEELINLLGNWNNLKLLDISDMEKGAVNTKVLKMFFNFINLFSYIFFMKQINWYMFLRCNFKVPFI